MSCWPPIILVTSLDSPADRARGIEVGADAYIVKSSFDQGNLLETIEEPIFLKHREPPKDFLWIPMEQSKGFRNWRFPKPK
jgi:DNA-binding NarL/FixJ family response regulator